MLQCGKLTSIACAAVANIDHIRNFFHKGHHNSGKEMIKLKR
jgi:hypothetical protein